MRQTARGLADDGVKQSAGESRRGRTRSRAHARGPAELTSAADLPVSPPAGSEEPRFQGAFRQFDNPEVLAPLAIGLILIALLLDALMLGLEIALPRDGTSLHQIIVIGIVVSFSAAVLSYRVLRLRIMQVAGLTARMETARRGMENADAANLAKTRYLENISHEIRSPLNAIYGYAQLVEQETDVRPQEAARIIRRCAEHMTSLIESLLDISRLEHGMLRVRSEIVRLPDFIDQIVLMMRPAAEAKGLDFVYEATTWTPEFVRTDQNRLRQALINLIGNAIKFSDAGTVTMRLAYRGQIGTIEITDTGPGIAPENQQRIFDPYEQVDKTDRHVRPGVGLGLPITKAIIEILGGNLELESEPGRGACFRVTLMLAEPTNAQARGTIHRRITGYEGPRRSVLLVDDDADQRGFLESFLAGCGLEVVSLADGESAVALCDTRNFDLAVLDISLPGMSGWDVASHLRARARPAGRSEPAPDLVIVMASANSQEFQRPQYDRPMHDHFFVKPYRLNEMAEVIAALLHFSWKWEATGGAGEAVDPPPGGLPANARAHVERLLERIQIGHVRGIEAEIAMLGTAAPNHGRLVSALYAALDEFDLAGMAKLLESA